MKLLLLLLLAHC